VYRANQPKAAGSLLSFAWHLAGAEIRRSETKDQLVGDLVNKFEQIGEGRNLRVDPRRGAVWGCGERSVSLMFSGQLREICGIHRNAQSVFAGSDYSP
jgi:hypothetical protein